MRLGIVGGTFDPIHNAHLFIAEEARVRFGLDRVLFVPNGVPAHKGSADVSPAAHRLAMAVLATADNPAFAVSRIELDRPGESYTADTLDALQEANPGSRLFFISGSDALAEIGTWHEPERVMARCTLIAAERPRCSLARLRAILGPAFDEHVLPMATALLDISATDVRRRVREGLPIRYLTPEAVIRYIEGHGLYQRGDAWATS